MKQNMDLDEQSANSSHDLETGFDHRSKIALILALLAMLVTGFGWAISTPVGSSPDDDYHLGSIWCPNPIDDNCETAEGQQGTLISVPEAASGEVMTCYAFNAGKSAACGMGKDDDRYTYSFRYDDGSYPGGYYRFHHLLVGHDVEGSVIRMRMANVLIAVTLIGTIAALSRSTTRRAMMLAVSAAWFPMGVYFIASNNPTSWAILGLFAYTAAAFSATQSRGWRRWALFVASIVAALICLATRYDSSFYLFVVALALTFAIRWDVRSRWPELALIWAFAVYGVYAMLGTGNQAAIPTNGGEAGAEFSIPHLVWGIASAPRYLAGFYGAFWTPGWVDVPTYEHAPYAYSLVAAGAVLMVALKRGSVRKWLSALVVLGAIIGLPAVFRASGVFPDLFSYQARYILPLYGVLLFLLLAQDLGRGPLFCRAQQVAVIALVGVAHSLTLYMTLLRYTRGAADGQPRTLLSGIEWWWDIPISPAVVWTLTTVAAVVFLAAATSTARRDFRESPMLRTRVG